MIVPVLVVAVVAAGALTFAVTREDGARARTGATSTYATSRQDSGDVTVDATLRELTETGAVAEVVFDTHAVELELDVAAGATLTVDGVAWPTKGWDGDGPSGHHREGELRFAAAGPMQGDAILSIVGLSDPVTFRWPIP